MAERGKDKSGMGAGLPEGREKEYTHQSHYIHGRMMSWKWDFRHHVVPPISQSVTYRLYSSSRGAMGFERFPEPKEGEPPVYIYDRLDEPTRAMLEENLAFAHGGEVAVCFASGMAAIAAALGVLVRAGDRIIAHRLLYGCTHSLLENWLPRLGVEVVRVDLNSPDELDQALNHRTRAVYLETPVNPDLDVIDIAALRAVVDEYNADRAPEERAYLIVDNTFATPYGQQPLRHGAHMVVESLTKDVGGFGTVMGGVVVAPRELYDDLRIFRKDFGGVMAPMSAWNILVYGLPTLPVRLHAQQETARKVATWLENHPLVREVRYPGLASFPDLEVAKRQMVSPDGDYMPGFLIYFTLHGGLEPARALLDFLAREAYSITLAVSLGQVKTLIELPSAMTHAALGEEGITEGGLEPGGIRLSVGLENPDDLIRDFERGFDWLRAELGERTLSPQRRSG